MENANLDLSALHQAMEEAIRQQFPAFKRVAFYCEDALDELNCPACLLEMSEAEPCVDQEMGTGQLAVNARFEARVVLDYCTERAQLEIRRLACALATWLHQHPWFHKMATGPVEVLAIVPDDFSPEVKSYVVWRVEWSQVLYLGETAWSDEGITAQSPLYSFAPKIGEQHEQDYQG